MGRFPNFDPLKAQILIVIKVVVNNTLHRAHVTDGVDLSVTGHSNATWKGCARACTGPKGPSVRRLPRIITTQFVSLVGISTITLPCGGARTAPRVMVILTGPLAVRETQG